MKRYWGKVIADDNKLIVEELLEFKNGDSQADYEMNGYVLIELENKYQKNIKQDYEKVEAEDNSRLLYRRRWCVG